MKTFHAIIYFRRVAARAALKERRREQNAFRRLCVRLCSPFSTTAMMKCSFTNEQPRRSRSLLGWRIFFALHLDNITTAVRPDDSRASCFARGEEQGAKENSTAASTNLVLLREIVAYVSGFARQTNGRRTVKRMSKANWNPKF